MFSKIEERVVFWRILVVYSNENGTMFCNSNMNKILSKVFLRIKRLFLNENLFSNFQCYKLVSEPWFEGFGHTFGGVWTQIDGLKDFLKENVF